jgi:hypothetical protein
MTQRSARCAAIAVLCSAAAVAAAVAPGFLKQRELERLRPGPGVTRCRQLSTYHSALAGGPGDTPVYELAGELPGGVALVLGGTHADETAAYLTAVLLVESARVNVGRVLVIPRANASGFTHTVPLEGHPQRVRIAKPDGEERVFSVGGRVTNPAHQWPDPQVHVLPDSGQKLSGFDTRNLNRAYPGRPDGTLTEQIAFAITRVLVEEGVDLAFDLHEAAPEYPVVNTIVAHQRASDLAALVSMDLDEAGVVIGLEASPEKLHGLSHREWGDATGALAVLMESVNPAQGRLRGRTDESLVVTGKDRFYALAGRRGRLAVPWTTEGWPIERRVARHVIAIESFLRNLGELEPEHRIEIVGLPGYHELIAGTLGEYLN